MVHSPRLRKVQHRANPVRPRFCGGAEFVRGLSEGLVLVWGLVTEWAGPTVGFLSSAQREGARGWRMHPERELGVVLFQFR
jgi:hypothetical protein